MEVCSYQTEQILFARLAEDSDWRTKSLKNTGKQNFGLTSSLCGSTCSLRPMYTEKGG